MTTRLRILVAAGLSGEDGRALARGVQLVGETGGNLAIVAMAEDGDAAHTAHRRKFLRQTLASLGGSEQTDIHVLVGDALERIVELASRWRADILIVDDGAISGNFLEPLATAVTCPLLVVRNSRTTPYRKVLVGAAPSFGTRHALEAALIIAPIAHFMLLRVLSFPGGFIPDCLPETPSDEEVEAVLGDLVLPEGQHDWLVRCGKAKGEIIFAAWEAKADLVALGNTLRVGLEKVLLGSVATETARALSCDVIIAHSEDHRP